MNENEEHLFHLHNGKTGAAIVVRISPRASRNEISEIQADGTIKIRLMAPPVEGQANKALIEFLADILETPKSNIEIISGQASRGKLVTIVGLDSDTVQARIYNHYKGKNSHN
ncbi:MAG TPA: DUF167 domain-containing protein [Anaerolineaceae bacterium]|nr:DUF167 domain-containing protein [Anaerolineaceae bacterium]